MTNAPLDARPHRERTGPPTRTLPSAGATPPRGPILPTVPLVPPQDLPAGPLVSPEELVAAAPAHAAWIGHSVDPLAYDPARPEHATTWSAFTRRSVRLPRGGHEGEWLLLELGLKPVLRSWLFDARLDALAPRCRRRGLVLVRGSAAGIGRPAPRADLHGPAPNATPGPRRAPAGLVYVARDRGQAEAARDAESALLADQRQVTDDDTRRRRDAHAARILGGLLGFPRCCVDAFSEVARDGRDERAGMLEHALAHSEAFAPRLNNLSLGAFHYIGWSPCRFDCAPSLAIADEAAAELRRRDQGAFVVVERILGRPRLWFDERRQLIFSGRFADGVLRFGSVRTPWALDGDDRHRALEWLFYAELAPLLIGGGALVQDGDGWTLHRSGEPPRPWSHRGGLFLPFARR